MNLQRFAKAIAAGLAALMISG
ncbi:MAG: hypothetical protein RLZZ590_949, partial [Actinomycetota bacterium]